MPTPANIPGINITITDEQWAQMKANLKTAADSMSDSATALESLAATSEAEYEKVRDSKDSTEAQMSEALTTPTTARRPTISARP